MRKQRSIDQLDPASGLARIFVKATCDTFTPALKRLEELGKVLRAQSETVTT